MLRNLEQKASLTSYGIAFLATITAVGIRWMFNPLLGQSLALVTIYGVVAFIAWLSGYKPAILAAVSGYLLANYIIIEPEFEFNLGFVQLVGFALYCIACSIIILLGEISRSAERRLLSKETDLRETLESITDGFYSLDTEWRFTYLNPAAERLMGRSARELLNKVIWVENPHIVGSEVEALYYRVMRDRIAGVTTLLYKPNGRWYEIRVYPSKKGLSVYFQDVTDKIETESLLKQQSQELAEMDRRKNEFLATLAHELRNPLAPIRNALSIMQLKGHDAVTVEKWRLLIEKQVSQMVRLIDDLMDVSRINHDKLVLKLESTTLAEVINAAVESCKPTIDAAGLQLTVALPPDPVSLHADLTRLTQVFINLLNNAAKFTNPGGCIDIFTAFTNVQDSDAQKQVTVNIRDNGIGITAEDQRKIFTGFIQLSNSLKRSHGGLGVGLMLVKRIIEMHHGSIAVHSEGPESGTTFSVTLPVLNQHSAIHSTQTTPTQIYREENETKRNLNIMVVDDNQDAANSLALYLKAIGYETMVAHDGNTAIELAAHDQPAVIFLDIGMPGMNGYEVAEYIRKQSWGKAIKLIAVTGWGQNEDRRKSTLAGFDDHLDKPVDPTLIHQIIKHLET